MIGEFRAANGNSRGPLPETLDVVSIHRLVGAENGHMQGLRQGHQQPVKRVTMMRGKQSRPGGLLNADGQLHESFELHETAQLHDERKGIDFSEIGLDCQFPTLPGSSVKGDHHRAISSQGHVASLTCHGVAP